MIEHQVIVERLSDFAELYVMVHAGCAGKVTAEVILRPAVSNCQRVLLSVCLAMRHKPHVYNNIHRNALHTRWVRRNPQAAGAGHSPHLDRCGPSKYY